VNRNELMHYARMGLESKLRELQQETERVKQQLKDLNKEVGEATPARASPIEPEPPKKRAWSPEHRRRFMATMRRKRREAEGG
jgi:cell division septum initiation protein DivIVA